MKMADRTQPASAVDNAAVVGLLGQLMQMYQQPAAEQPQPGTSMPVPRGPGLGSQHANFTPSRLRLPSGSRHSVTPPDHVSNERNSDDDFEDDRPNHRRLRHTTGPILQNKKRTRPAPLRDSQSLQKKKRARQVTKEAVVIPHSERPDVDGTYTVPAGEKMRALVARQLVGMIRFTTTSSAEEIDGQIEALFGKFKHRYLKVLPGAKRMAPPRIAPDMEWDGAALLAVTGQGKLYILAEEDVQVLEEPPPLPAPTRIPRHPEENDQEHGVEQSLPVRANLCPAGHSLASRAGPCLVCTQEADYAESLAIDREEEERQQLEQQKKEDDAAAAKIISDDSDSENVEVASNTLNEERPKPLHNPSHQRVICQKCSTSRSAEVEDCLRCKQNEELRRSEMVDKIRQYRIEAEKKRDEAVSSSEEAARQAAKQATEKEMEGIRSVAIASLPAPPPGRGKTIKFKFPCDETNDSSYRFPANVKWELSVGCRNSVPTFCAIYWSIYWSIYTCTRFNSSTTFE